MFDSLQSSGNAKNAYFHAHVALCVIICHYAIQAQNLYNFVGLFGRGPGQIRSNKK